MSESIKDRAERYRDKSAWLTLLAETHPDAYWHESLDVWTDPNLAPTDCDGWDLGTDARVRYFRLYKTLGLGRVYCDKFVYLTSLDSKTLKMILPLLQKRILT